MADAKDKGQATGPDDVKKATADSAKKADEAKTAAAKADSKAKDATKSTGAKAPAADKADTDKGTSTSHLPAREDTSEMAKAHDAELKAAEGSYVDKRPPESEHAVSEKDEATRRNDEASFKADGSRKDVSSPLDEAPGEEAMGASKKARKVPSEEDLRAEARRLTIDDKSPHQSFQQQEQELLNRRSAHGVNDYQGAAPAGSSPAPREAAKLGCDPLTAHDINESDEDAVLEQRLRLAQESRRVEKRPGITSGTDLFDDSYTVEAELRAQWPEIKLGDDNPEE